MESDSGEPGYDDDVEKEVDENLAELGSLMFGESVVSFFVYGNVDQVHNNFISQ